MLGTEYALSADGQHVAFTDTGDNLLGGDYNAAEDSYVLSASSAAFWEGYAGDGQHTALSAVASQPLNAIRWQTPVDLQPQYSGSELLIHYGAPSITPANTVLVPVKTGSQRRLRDQRVQRQHGAVSCGRTRPTTSCRPIPAGRQAMSPVLTPAGPLLLRGRWRHRVLHR